MIVIAGLPRCDNEAQTLYVRVSTSKKFTCLVFDEALNETRGGGQYPPAGREGHGGSDLQNQCCYLIHVHTVPQLVSFSKVPVWHAKIGFGVMVPGARGRSGAEVEAGERD